MVEIKEAVCCFCGCLCDDILVEVSDNKIIKVKNACKLGYSRIAGHHPRFEAPMIRENGEWKKVSYEEAIAQAAKLLASAKRPLLYGWASTSNEAISKGLELCETIGGVYDQCASVCHGPSIVAVAGVGAPGATLGQIKNRADLIIYWGCNPMEAHPRHMSRYSIFPRGYFRSKGREDRKFVVVDVRKTNSANIADMFVQVEPNQDYAVISAIRAILRKHEAILPEKIGGVPKEQIKTLVEWMKKAKFGVIYFGLGLTMSRGRYKNVEVAIQLIDDLNAITKFTITPMRGHYNVTGAGQVAAWEYGFPYAIDFSRGYPYYNPGETASNDLLERGEVDTMLVIASDPGAHFPQKSVAHMAKIPIIQIDPFPNATTELASIVIPPALMGVEAEGTAYRMDAVPIRAPKLIESEKLSDYEIVSRILEKVKELKAKGA